jgi:predicted permease
MHDLRFALRLLRQNPTFSLTVVVILALCIGANTAVLSVVNTAMVRPLAYPEPDRLAQVVAVFHGHDREEVDDSVDGASWETVRDHVPSIDAAVYTDWISGVNLGVEGNGVYVKQQRVSTGFFRVLGIAPRIGREFDANEDRAGGPSAVILSEALWRRYFHGDPGIVGRSILLRGEPFTVVGVMSAFQWSASVDLWAPIRPSRTGEGSGSNYGIIARLRPGVKWAQASSELASLVPELKRLGSFPRNANVRLDLASLQAGMARELRQPMMILWAAVGAVFVLGCVNIGGMLLARSSGRMVEMATRLALGAPVSRIVRQLLIESCVLGLLGGVLGVGVGWAALEALKKLGAGAFGFLRMVDFDWRVLLATLLLTLIAGVAFGLVPAYQAARVDLRSAQTGSRGVAGKKRFVSLGTLVSGQIALTVPLLIGAGLLLRTFLFLWNLNPGFDPSHVLTARFSLQDVRYATSRQMNQLYRKTLDRLRETPGIESAAVSLSLPYERGLNNGFKLPGDDQDGITNLNYVSPEYFAALRIPLLEGRTFADSDNANSAPVAIANQAFVSRYFKDRPALGQPLIFGGKAATLIAVAGNILEQRAGWGDFGPIAPVPTVYIPAEQTSDGMMMVHVWFSPNWIVRGALSESQMIRAIDQATRSVDPLLPMAEFRSIGDLKTESLELQRFMAALVDALAGLAGLLTAFGIYGLIANLVTERTRELGIRMALGSSRSEAVWITLRPALLWVVMGIVVGSAAAIALGRFLRSFLWGVEGSDAITIAGVAAGMLLATMLASWIPAAKIVRLNPADTLRSE